ncbi:hypothetical protein TI03_04695, partial [Achromatium sp. WMS1]
MPFHTSVLHQLLATQQFTVPVAANDLQITKITELISVYDLIYPQLERLMWHSQTSLQTWLNTYQALFREQQLIIDQSNARLQHQFILSIPVADRPIHLHNCLESIYQLCKLYSYGGQDSDGYYTKIKVIVAEDSFDS